MPYTEYLDEMTRSLESFGSKSNTRYIYALVVAAVVVAALYFLKPKFMRSPGDTKVNNKRLAIAAGVVLVLALVIAYFL